MTLRLAPLLFTLLTLAACKPSEAPAPAASTAAVAEQQAAASDVAAVAAPTEATAGAPVADSEPAPAHAGPIVAPSGPAPVAGTDYVEIIGGRPYQPLDGRIEVVEVFGYICPACARFQPLVSAWKHKLSADVRFSYVPAPFGPQWIPYAKAYYVAESMGLVDQTHDALINAIHIKNTMPGEGDKPDEMAIARFYGSYGANPQQFVNTMRSFSIDAKVNRGKQFMMRSGVEGTPTIVVDGKYRVLGKSYEDVLRITDHLVARERAAHAGAPASPATGG